MEENRIVDEKVLVVYNPYLRKILIYHMNYGTSEIKTFKSECDWVTFYHPEIKDEFLDVQLDYDLGVQLIVYFRYLDDNNELDNCVSWHSEESHKDVNIFIVHTDLEWDIAVASLPNLEFYKDTRILEVKKQK